MRSKAIYKYPFAMDGEHVIEIPVGSSILHVGTDPTGVECLWALVDRDDKPVTHKLHILGTGHEYPKGVNLEHLRTVIEGSFVWHVFIERISALTVEGMKL